MTRSSGFNRTLGALCSLEWFIGPTTRVRSFWAEALGGSWKCASQELTVNYLLDRTLGISGWNPQVPMRAPSGPLHSKAASMGLHSCNSVLFSALSNAPCSRCFRAQWSPETALATETPACGKDRIQSLAFPWRLVVPWARPDNDPRHRTSI